MQENQSKAVAYKASNLWLMVTVLHPQVTDHATTALLHYQLPQMPDVVVRSFMVSSFEGQAFQLRRDLMSQPQVIPETSIRAEQAVSTEVAF